MRESPSAVWPFPRRPRDAESCCVRSRTLPGTHHLPAGAAQTHLPVGRRNTPMTTKSEPVQPAGQDGTTIVLDAEALALASEAAAQTDETLEAAVPPPAE